MPMQNYVRAAAAPESRAPSAWKAFSWDGGMVHRCSQNQWGAGGGTHDTGFATWLLHHNHRYLHLLRWERLMLSDGVLMCNVQEAHAADVPASTKPGFWNLAAPRIEVTDVCNPSLVWRRICHGCNCADAILSGKHGPRQHWMTCIVVLQVVSAPRLCTRTAVPVAEFHVQMSSQSMNNQSTVLACSCGSCSAPH